MKKLSEKLKKDKDNLFTEILVVLVFMLVV